jgi:hypothetical protein
VLIAVLVNTDKVKGKINPINMMELGLLLQAAVILKT